MGRKKRSVVHLRSNEIRYKISSWCHSHPSEDFTVPGLAEEFGMNPDSREDCMKIYMGLTYWRDKAIETYKHMVATGMFPVEADSQQRWDFFLLSYNRNDAYVFLFNHETGTYFQPSFKALEKMDKKRLSRQWHGILTVIEEMKVYDTKLALSDGSSIPVRELVDAGRNVDLLLDRHEAEESGTGPSVEPAGVSVEAETEGDASEKKELISRLRDVLRKKKG